VAQDKYAIPLATVHLSPSIFLSAHAPPRLPGLRLLPGWTPRWVTRGVLQAMGTGIDALIAPQLNAFRAEVGLDPVKGVLRGYWHSPRRVIGLFPEWFAEPQADWPPQVRLTGFPLFDEPDLSPVTEELEAFLCAGEPPVAFTPGSAMWQGRRFFEASVDACVRTGHRGLLLTRHTDHLPARLPPGVIHVHYAPFSRLLPRCAALVHHGGIGSSAQGLAAGVPQLVTPFAHDQPDNAERLRRLGVARVLPPQRYTGPRIAAALRGLTGSAAVAQACQDVAGRFAGHDAIGQTCELIEALGSPAAIGDPPARIEPSAA
jgi:UDP:flavonoid glycosyltransferase YjiC (YdhE family)